MSLMSDIGAAIKNKLMVNDFASQSSNLLTGGGTVSVSAAWEVKWSTRFITISNCTGSGLSTSGYFSINMPAAGTVITGVGGATNKTVTANGIPIADWETLYYILPVGGGETTVNANFRVANYTANVTIPSTWVKICSKNGDGSYIDFACGVSLRNNTSINTNLYDVKGANVDGAVGSANTLATARTINGVSFDGSANITVSDSTAVKLTGNQTIADVKTFSSSPIVPTPTTNFQSVPLRSTNITVNVGAGQTYTTINQALEYLSGFYPMYKQSGVAATINLKAGFVMAEQVLVSGIDLGWITIVGEDAETIITHTALTTAFNGANYPVFGVDKGGTSPVIGQLFRFNVEKAGGNKHGLMSFGAGSSANVLPGKGFIGAGGYGIYASSASTINANSANCSNAGGYGIYASSASTINAQSANCSNAGGYGIYAIDGSTINANSANCSNAGTHGIFASSASTINANSANCSNAGGYGIYASSASTITAQSALVQNQTTGTARVAVAVGSTINTYAINTTGGTVPVFNQAVNTLTQNGIIYQ